MSLVQGIAHGSLGPWVDEGPYYVGKASYRLGKTSYYLGKSPYHLGNSIDTDPSRRALFPQQGPDEFSLNKTEFRESKT
jgi:hypothetical protein